MYIDMICIYIYIRLKVWAQRPPEAIYMRRHYQVCKGCHSSWIWADRVVQKPGLCCNQCGRKWQQPQVPDLRQRRVEWASWNFQKKGQQWPKKSYKETLIDPPPGLQGGKPNRPPKMKGIEKKLQEHWTNIPDVLKKQLEEMGIKGAQPAPPPDLPTLIKDHLESLPTVLKEEVEKIIQPTKMEPPLNQKLKQAVGTLKQLSEKKAAIQTKADAIKQQYTQLLNELKETQSKIEAAQKDLQETTNLYNQQLEQEKQVAEEPLPEELAAENLLTVMANIGLSATPDQVKELAQKLSENVMKSRKCG